MNRIVFIDRYGNTSVEDTIYEYSLNEIIRVNSNSLYKCIEIISENNEKKFIFKEGKVVYKW